MPSSTCVAIVPRMSPLLLLYEARLLTKNRENYVRPTVLPPRPVPVAVSSLIQFIPLSDVDIIPAN